MESTGFDFRASDRRKLGLYLRKGLDKAAHLRVLAVYRMCCGVSVSALADQLQVSRQAIYKWVRLYCASHDPVQLLSPHRSGRPRQYDPISKERIVEALRLDPSALGFASGTWTVALLAGYLNERYATHISAHTLRRRMKELGLRYKRPKYVYEEKEPHLAQKKGRSSAS